MSAATVAGVYGQALLEIADERGVRSAVVQNCRDLAESLNAETLSQLDDTRLGKLQAKDAIRQLFTGKIEKEVVDLFLLLVDRNRLSDALAILREAVRLAEVQVGLVRVQVTTASPLSATAAESIRQKLRSNSGGGVVMVQTVDPDLIGGLTMRLDDLLIDGSVRRHLSEMRKRIIATPLQAQQMWA